MKTAKLEKLREQISTVELEIASIEQARLTTPEIEARVDAFIQEMKDEVQSEILDAAGGLTYDRHPGSAPGSWALVRSWVRTCPYIGFSMAVTLNPQAFRAMILEAALKTLNGERQEHAIERGELVAELQAKRHSLELDEEAEVIRLEESGIDVLRRADADPAVVLGFAA